MPREIIRCSWVTKDPLYIDYHDIEWGTPIYDDRLLFKSLLLETFQSGLSWITILKKRENFSKLFDNFNYLKISNYSDEKLAILLKDQRIIRHKGKIKASRINANAFIKIQDEFGSFSNYIWSFVKNKPIKNSFKYTKEIPSETKLSNKISQDLRKRGFKFVGPITIYSFMQAIGIVNDHTTNCFKYKK